MQPVYRGLGGGRGKRNDILSGFTAVISTSPPYPMATGGLALIAVIP